MTVVELKLHRNGFVAQLDGIADRDVAQSISGRSIGVPDSALPETGDDEAIDRVTG